LEYLLHSTLYQSKVAKVEVVNDTAGDERWVVAEEGKGSIAGVR
jgi:hypothetical protein